MEKKYLIIKQDMLDEFMLYLTERENAEATKLKYSSDIKIFIRFLGEKKEVDKETLVKYKQWLSENYAVASANSMIASLNQFLICFDAGRLKLRQFKVQRSCFRSEEKELSKKEYQRLLQAAVKQGREQTAMIIETIAATGIRVGELKFFTTSAVRKGKLEVRNKGKHRVIIIPGKLKRKLICYIAKYKIQEGAIFVTRGGKPKDRSNIWKELKKLAEDAKVDREKIFPHNLRHLFARAFYSATKDIIGLADLLGHSNISVTRIYAHNSIRYYKGKIEELGLVS